MWRGRRNGATPARWLTRSHRSCRSRPSVRDTSEPLRSRQVVSLPPQHVGLPRVLRTRDARSPAMPAAHSSRGAPWRTRSRVASTSRRARPRTRHHLRPTTVAPATKLSRAHQRWGEHLARTTRARSLAVAARVLAAGSVRRGDEPRERERASASAARSTGNGGPLDRSSRAVKGAAHPSRSRPNAAAPAFEALVAIRLPAGPRPEVCTGSPTSLASQP